MAYRAFDYSIPELGICDISFLPSQNNMFRVAILYNMHGKKHVKVYSLDIANKTFADINPALLNVSLPESASKLIPCRIN